ncbi:MAG: hypothetical protein C4332_00275 [Meiothermus sp.]
MKVPRDISGERLVRVLQRMGCEVARQDGSYTRLVFAGKPVHKITVPNHNPIKVGLLQALLKELAERQGISMEQLIEKL